MRSLSGDTSPERSFHPFPPLSSPEKQIKVVFPLTFSDYSGRFYDCHLLKIRPLHPPSPPHPPPSPPHPPPSPPHPPPAVECCDYDKLLRVDGLEGGGWTKGRIEGKPHNQLHYTFLRSGQGSGGMGCGLEGRGRGHHGLQAAAMIDAA